MWLNMLYLFLSTDDDCLFTHACIIVQIALKSGLHQLLKGAYNSGTQLHILVINYSCSLVLYFNCNTILRKYSNSAYASFMHIICILGLLKLGMRTTFNHIRQQLRKFMDVTQVSSISTIQDDI